MLMFNCCLTVITQILTLDLLPSLFGDLALHLMRLILSKL